MHDNERYIIYCVNILHHMPYILYRLCIRIITSYRPLLQQLLISGTAGLLDQEPVCHVTIVHQRMMSHDMTGKQDLWILMVNVCSKISFVYIYIYMLNYIMWKAHLFKANF